MIYVFVILVVAFKCFFCIAVKILQSKKIRFVKKKKRKKKIKIGYFAFSINLRPDAEKRSLKIFYHLKSVKTIKILHTENSGGQKCLAKNVQRLYSRIQTPLPLSKYTWPVCFFCSSFLGIPIAALQIHSILVTSALLRGSKKVLRKDC